MNQLPRSSAGAERGAGEVEIQLDVCAIRAGKFLIDGSREFLSAFDAVGLSYAWEFIETGFTKSCSFVLQLTAKLTERWEEQVEELTDHAPFFSRLSSTIVTTLFEMDGRSPLT